MSLTTINPSSFRTSMPKAPLNTGRASGPSGDPTYVS